MRRMNNNMYKLTAVISHRGIPPKKPTSHFGHFISHVRDPSGQINECNDDVVTPATVNDLLGQGNQANSNGFDPVILTYVRMS